MVNHKGWAFPRTYKKGWSCHVSPLVSKPLRWSILLACVYTALQGSIKWRILLKMSFIWYVDYISEPVILKGNIAWWSWRDLVTHSKGKSDNDRILKRCLSCPRYPRTAVFRGQDSLSGLTSFGHNNWRFLLLLSMNCTGSWEEERQESPNKRAIDNPL